MRRGGSGLVFPAALVQPGRRVLGEFGLASPVVAVALSASDDLGGRGLLEGRGPRLAGPLLRLLQRVDRPELQPVGVIVAAGLGGALRLRGRRRNGECLALRLRCAYPFLSLFPVPCSLFLSASEPSLSPH